MLDSYLNDLYNAPEAVTGWALNCTDSIRFHSIPFDMFNVLGGQLGPHRQIKKAVQ